MKRILIYKRVQYLFVSMVLDSVIISSRTVETTVDIRCTFYLISMHIIVVLIIFAIIEVSSSFRHTPEQIIICDLSLEYFRGCKTN